MLNLIDSHDTNRSLYVLTVAGDAGLAQAKERLKLSALFQFTYPGAPMVYYGDEAALNAPSLANGPNGPEDDPYNRAPYPWADEAGDANAYGPADQTVVNYYTTLAHMRKQHPALRTGSFETLLTGDKTPSTTDDNTYAFARVGGGETAIVALNNGAGGNTASVPVAAYFADGTQLRDALSGATYTVNGGQVNLTLAARSGAVIFDASSVPVDTNAPVAAIAVNPPADANGWHNSAPVTVNLTATDGGSGVKELRYWINGGGVTVVEGGAASVTVSAEGVTTVSVRAIDNAGNVSGVATQAIKLDLTPPAIGGASANPSVLSSPNHKLRDVTVAYNVSDNFSPAICTLGVASNEPVNGTGDGDTAPDWEVLDAHRIRLRAERSGAGAGRVYTVTITCADAAGNTSNRALTVTVPRGR
jgi:hypothetical protein